MPLPCSKFLLTLNLGSGGDFLASPLFAQEFNKKGKIQINTNIFDIFFEIMAKSKYYLVYTPIFENY
jgi:hypothetical protein